MEALLVGSLSSKVFVNIYISDAMKAEYSSSPIFLT